MATYTVQSGDTLSQIASKYKVPIASISGYRSGNPNLIFPGEVLNIGQAPLPRTPAPQAPAPNFSSMSQGPIYVPPPTPQAPQAPQAPPKISQPPIALQPTQTPSPGATPGSQAKPQLTEEQVKNMYVQQMGGVPSFLKEATEYLNANPGAKLPNGADTAFNEFRGLTPEGATKPVDESLGGQDTSGTTPDGTSPETGSFDWLKGLMSNFGISMPSSNQSPVSSAADFYKQFAEQYGLFDTRKQIKDIVEKETSEIASVNENPWISEALRSKKVSQIQDKYDMKQKLLQSQFDRADEDARFLTGKYLEQVHQTQQNTQDILFKAIDIASKEITARRSERKFEIQQEGLESRFQRTQAERQKQFQLKQQGVGSTVQLDQPTVDLMAQTYLTTGNIPSLGFGTAGAAQRAQIFKRAAQIAKQQGLTGQDVALNKAAFAANQQALGQLSRQKNLAESFEKTAVKNLNLALSISNKTTRAGAPILTKWVQSVQTGVFADPQVQQLQNAVQTAVNEYAKVVTGQTTGAAVSDSARNETANLLNAAFSPRQFRAAVEVLKKEMNNRIQGFDEQTRQLQGEIKGGPTTLGASEKQQRQERDMTQEQRMSDEDAYQLYLQSVGQ